MHSFLKSIGFGNIDTEQQMEDVLDEVFRRYADRSAVKKRENGTAFVEYTKAFGPGIGITLCGEMDQNGFHQEYYFPYFEGSGVTTREDVVVEKHGGRDSYAGVIEEPRAGISLIFYVQNAAAYRKACMDGRQLNPAVTTTFSGLAERGMILLPVSKSEEQVRNDREALTKRTRLIAAARQGDEEAIESLTLEDMDTYSMVSQRIHEEDVFTIVDTFLMPYGLESDQYQIMGEIRSIRREVNEYTREKLYFMTLSCNDMVFDICINQKDLFGEPEVGRRFKGNIWMQGHINFEKRLD